MRISKVGLFVATVMASATLAPGQCLPYEPAPVRLDGVLTEHAGLRSWWSVKLESPICMQKSSDDPSGIAYAGVADVQLIFFHQGDLEAYKSALNKRVIVSGKLTPRVTAYHETNVLIMVDRITLASGAAPAASVPANARPLRNLVSYVASVTVIPGSPGKVSKVAWDIDPKSPLPDSDRYIDHMFNGPKDVMWVKCHDGYTLAVPSSSTDSKMFPMDTHNGTNPYWGILVSDKQPSNITVRCIRAND